MSIQRGSTEHFRGNGALQLEGSFAPKLKHLSFRLSEKKFISSVPRRYHEARLKFIRWLALTHCATNAIDSHDPPGALKLKHRINDRSIEGERERIAGNRTKKELHEKNTLRDVKGEFQGEEKERGRMKIGEKGIRMGRKEAQGEKEISRIKETIGRKRRRRNCSCGKNNAKKGVER